MFSSALLQWNKIGCTWTGRKIVIKSVVRFAWHCDGLFRDLLLYIVLQHPMLYDVTYCILSIALNSIILQLRVWCSFCLFVVTRTGGRCIDEHGRYRCVCPAGYTGDRCENNLNDCLQNPCLNGASCIDGVNHFQCRCLPGFTGDLCQDNVDDCLTHPCANGGTCYDRDNGFRCHCAPGFSGRDCSLKIDECQSRPCINGVCHDLMNGYRCLCDNGFSGVNCDKSIDPMPTPTTPVFSRTEVANGSLYSSPPPEVSDDGSNLRYLVLVICLSVVLTLFALFTAIVVVVLHRRRRLRPAVTQSFLAEKMNNADVRSGFESVKAASGDDDESGFQQQQQHLQHHQQQRFIDFTTKEQMQMQRNINHTKNLKNVEKCPSRKPNALSAWRDNSSSADPLSSSLNKPADAEKHLDKPESRTNNKVTETSMWKQRFAHKGSFLSVKIFKSHF